MNPLKKATLCHSPSLLSSQIKSEVEVGWAQNKVYLKGGYSTCIWTPDQAEQLAGILLKCAEKAREKEVFA